MFVTIHRKLTNSLEVHLKPIAQENKSQTMTSEQSAKDQPMQPFSSSEDEAPHPIQSLQKGKLPAIVDDEGNPIVLSDVIYFFPFFNLLQEDIEDEGSDEELEKEIELETEEIFTTFDKMVSKTAFTPEVELDTLIESPTADMIILEVLQENHISVSILTDVLQVNYFNSFFIFFQGFEQG